MRSPAAADKVVAWPYEACCAVAADQPTGTSRSRMTWSLYSCRALVGRREPVSSCREAGRSLNRGLRGAPTGVTDCGHRGHCGCWSGW
jgi:hypothetical protein